MKTLEDFIFKKQQNYTPRANGTRLAMQWKTQ